MCNDPCGESRVLREDLNSSWTHYVGEGSGRCERSVCVFFHKYPEAEKITEMQDVGSGRQATSAQKIVSSGRRSKSPEFVLKFRGCARSVEVGRGWREVEGLGGISDPQIWAQSPYHVGGHTPVPFGHPRHITTSPTTRAEREQLVRRQFVLSLE